MTSFEGELRHYCRSPKCRTKLKEPAANMHKAFCSRGCHDGFYANRCLVCEKEKPKGSRTDRKLCRRSECRSAYRQNRLIFTFPVHPASLRTLSSKSAHSTGIKTGDFRHCATVPDGPNGRWPGGRYERIEAANRHLLEAHFDKLDSTATDFLCGLRSR